MIRFYCDVCGVELEKAEHKRIIKKLGKVQVEILVAVEGVTNGGHICHGCVWEVLAKGDG